MRIFPYLFRFFLKGSLVIFHKNSLYNNLVSEYKGEHDNMPAEIRLNIVLGNMTI